MGNTYPMAGSGPSTAPARMASKAPKRLDALDFTKGALVLCMVLYHSLNIFRSDRGGEWLRYLRFLPPSFIFLTGFLLAHVYPAKYEGDRLRLYRRLLFRGARLLALFVLLNVVVSMAVRRNYNGMELGLGTLLDNWDDILLLGGHYRAVFEVLAPISYLLMLGGFLMAAHRAWRWSLPVLVLAAAAADFISTRQGLPLPLVEMLGIGVLGMILGFSSEANLRLLWKYRWIVVGLEAVYLLTLTFYGENELSQALGVCVVVSFIYVIAEAAPGSFAATRALRLLGQYSLVGYIAQIALLQILARVLPHSLPVAPRLSIAGVIAAAGTLATVAWVRWARQRSAAVNKVYQAIFA